MSVNLSRLYVRGDRIPTEVLELVRKWGTAQEGEPVTAAAANAAIAHEREAVGWQVSVGDDVTHAEWNGEVRQAGIEARAEAAIDWSQVTTRPDDDRPVEFPPASVLDPAPVERLQATVEDVRYRRTGGITIPVRVEPDEDSQRLLGTAVRRDALHAAAIVYQGRAHDVGTEAILLAADDFAAWLRDEPLPVPDGAAWLPTGDPAPPPGSGPVVLGWTFDQLRRMADHADPAEVERVTALFDAALADDRLQPAGRALLSTGLAILRRQR